jgi:hypothetical protein
MLARIVARVLVGGAYDAAAASGSRLVVEMSAGVSLRHLTGTVFVDPRLERVRAAESSSGVKRVSGCDVGGREEPDLMEVERRSALKRWGASSELDWLFETSTIDL